MPIATPCCHRCRRCWPHFFLPRCHHHHSLLPSFSLFPRHTRLRKSPTDSLFSRKQVASSVLFKGPLVAASASFSFPPLSSLPPLHISSSFQGQGSASLLHKGSFVQQFPIHPLVCVRSRLLLPPSSPCVRLVQHNNNNVRVVVCANTEGRGRETDGRQTNRMPLTLALASAAEELVGSG